MTHFMTTPNLQTLHYHHCLETFLIFEVSIISGVEIVFFSPNQFEFV